MSYLLRMKMREFSPPQTKGVAISKGRGKGGHVLAKFEGKGTTIPCHGAKDVDPEFLKRICKQLGIEPKEIL